MPLARTIATREAHREDDIDDLVQVGMLAYHRAMKRRRRRGAQHPKSFAGTVLVRAMRGYYWRTREWQGRGEPNLHASLEDVLTVAGPSVAHDANFDLGDYLTELERCLGPQARLMVENLISPSGECARRILEEVRGKQSVRKNRKGINLPRGVTKRVRLTPRMVRDALAVTPTAWVAKMAEIRQFTTLWLALER